MTAVAGGATGGVLLLVEDDTSIGRLVKQYLEGQDGWQVLWLRTGEEAVAARHAGTSLYPAPRTVRIPSGSPSLRRSCATCMSTVRVPPG